MRDTGLLIFLLAATVTFGLGIRLLTPPDVVTLDRSAWTCTDRDDGVCYEWRRGHHHELSGSAKR